MRLTADGRLQFHVRHVMPMTFKPSLNQGVAPRDYVDMYHVQICIMSRCTPHASGVISAYLFLHYLDP